jgi:hypothetical protein
MDPTKVAQMVNVPNGLTARDALCLLVGCMLTVLMRRRAMRNACAFSKHYPPENYVIGALSDSLKLMAGWVLRWLSAVRTRLRQRLDLLLEFIALRHQLAVLQRQAHGVHASARVSGYSGCSYRAGGQIGSAV